MKSIDKIRDDAANCIARTEETELIEQKLQERKTLNTYIGLLKS